MVKHAYIHAHRLRMFIKKTCAYCILSIYIFFDTVFACLPLCIYILICPIASLFLCRAFHGKKPSDPAARLSGIIIGPAQDLSLDEKAY